MMNLNYNLKQNELLPNTESVLLPDTESEVLPDE